ncbi:MAG: S41 family peptidase [Phycisphaerae bacterium]
MRLSRPLWMVTLLTMLATTATAQFQDRPPNPQPNRGFDRAAPFTQVRWNEATPEVMVQAEWYELLALNDTPASEIVAFCRGTFGERWQKRFSEDLVEVLSKMDRPSAKTVKLKLRNLKTGETTEIADAEMSEANRNAVWQANLQAQQTTEANPVKPVTADEVRTDLAELARAIREQFSYATLKQVDIAAEIAAIEKKFEKGTTTAAFAIEVQKFIAKFGDGHSRVRRFSSYMLGGFLPCDVALWGERVAAVRTDGQLLDPDRPFIKSIDDRPIEQWLAAAEKFVADGSPQLKRRRAVELLPFLSALRREMNLTDELPVKIELDGAGVPPKPGTTNRADSRVRGLPPQRRESRVLDGNIGYLRLEAMNESDEFLASLDEQMHKFRETKALIIDVRGNGGGSRAPLRTLFPYFMKADESPMVTNVAVYRIRKGDDAKNPAGFLGNRWLYPAAWTGWNDAERGAIKAIADQFGPEWKLPEGQFSDWHYFVLRRDLNPKAYHYDKPVVVLMDNDCFSATDIFLAAMKGRSGVKLVGEPSSGGSGRAAGVPLRGAGIEVMLSTMASFRIDGKLFDTRGVEPDDVMSPQLEDVLGLKDGILDRVVSKLK